MCMTVLLPLGICGDLEGRDGQSRTTWSPPEGLRNLLGTRGYLYVGETLTKPLPSPETHFLKLLVIDPRALPMLRELFTTELYT